MTTQSFTLKPVAEKGRQTRLVVVAVYNDARKIPRVETTIGRYAKVKQKHYIGVEDRYDNLVDRIAVYILEDVVNTAAVKNMLKGLEKAGDIEAIVKQY